MDENVQNSRAGFWTFTLTILGFLIFGVVALVLYYSTAGQPTYDEQRAVQRKQTLETRRKEDAAVLNTVAWVDQEKKIAHVPIQEGMEMALLALRDKPVQATNVQVPPPPAPAPATTETPAASPAPAAAATPVPAAAQPTPVAPAGTPAPEAAPAAPATPQPAATPGGGSH